MPISASRLTYITHQPNSKSRIWNMSWYVLCAQHTKLEFPLHTLANNHICDVRTIAIKDTRKTHTHTQMQNARRTKQTGIDTPKHETITFQWKRNECASTSEYRNRCRERKLCSFFRIIYGISHYDVCQWPNTPSAFTAHHRPASSRYNFHMKTARPIARCALTHSHFSRFSSIIIAITRYIWERIRMCSIMWISFSVSYIRICFPTYKTIGVIST